MILTIGWPSGNTPCREVLFSSPGALRLTGDARCLFDVLGRHLVAKGTLSIRLWWFTAVKQGGHVWCGRICYFFSGFYYSAILAFLFSIHGISLVQSHGISSWPANRKMSELQDQTAKLNAGNLWLNQTEAKSELKFNTRTHAFIVELKRTLGYSMYFWSHGVHNMLASKDRA